MDCDTVDERVLKKKNHFLINNLKVKIPVAKSAALRAELESDLKEGLDKKALNKIDTDTNRFGKGHGTFGPALDKAKLVGPMWNALLTGDTIKVKTGVFSTKDVAVTPDWMEVEFTSLFVAAKEWGDTNTDPGDETRAAKQNACKTFMKLAWQGLMGVKMLKLDALRKEIDNKKGTPDVVDNFRELDAQILCMSDKCVVKPADDGSSDVLLIKGPGGEVLYAYKSVAGESTQMRSPKGAGALRECLASRLFEEMDLNFDWPKSTLCELPGADGRMQLGVLIDGLPGTPADKLKSSVIQALPDKAKQTFLMASMVSCQLDAKWGNCFLQETGKGVTMRPSDGGAIGPSDDMLMDFVLARGFKVGETLMKDNDGQRLDSAGKSLDKDVCNEFIGLKVEHLKEVMQGELVRLTLKAPGLDPGALGVSDGVPMIVGSMVALKTILSTKGGQLTFEGLIDEYHSEFLKKYAENQKPAWEKSCIVRYLNLKTKLGSLLPDIGDMTGEVLFNCYLDPEMIPLWEAIHQLSQEVDLAKLGAAVPFKATWTAKNAISNLKTIDIPANVKERYPLIFPQKKKKN
jgi:hypothetical protein